MDAVLSRFVKGPTQRSLDWGCALSIAVVRFRLGLCSLDGVVLSRSEADEHLAEVVAAQDAELALDGVVDAIDERLAPGQRAVGDPAGRLAGVLPREVVVVADEEALDRAARLDEPGEVARPGRRLGVVVDGDGAADGDASTEAQGADGRLEMVAPDVVEVDVDAVGRSLPQQVGDATVLFVGEGRIEAEVAQQVVDLLLRARTADDAARPQGLGNLADGAAVAPAAPETKTTSPALSFATRP